MIPERDDIRNAEIYGYPKPPKEYICPWCLKICDTIYTRDGVAVGCDQCMKVLEAFEYFEEEA